MQEHFASRAHVRSWSPGIFVGRNRFRQPGELVLLHPHFRKNFRPVSAHSRRRILVGIHLRHCVACEEGHHHEKQNCEAVLRHCSLRPCTIPPDSTTSWSSPSATDVSGNLTGSVIGAVCEAHHWAKAVSGG